MIIGSGGREHALAWKVAQNKEVSRVYVAPGNAGTALNPDMVNVPISSVADLLAFAQKEQINLTIVGPEAPLSMGDSRNRATGADIGISVAGTG